MRLVFAFVLPVVTLLLVGSSVVGCAATKPTEPTPTYQCPACKEVVRWKIRADRFGAPANWKTVAHRCPSCNNQWVAGVSHGNACAMCGEGSLECPICAKYHPGPKS